MPRLLKLFGAAALLLAGAAGRPDIHAQQQQAPQLDREFYNKYLDSMPDERVLRNETLLNNLARVVKKLVPREDPYEGPAHVRGLDPKTLLYGPVDPNSPFVRGIMKELPYLRITPYMYVIKSGPYIIFATFRVDPRAFITAEHQSKTIKEKSQDIHNGPSR